MKKTIFLVLAFMVLSTMSFAGKDGFGGNTGLGLGVMNNNGNSEMVLKLHLKPEFAFGPLGVGFNVTAFVGNGGLADVNGDGEHNFKDVDFGFRFIEWKQDELQLRYGTLDNFTLGHGSLVYRYSNNEKTSFMAGVHYPKVVGVQGFIPLQKDIFGKEIKAEEQPKAMAARAYVRPLKLFLDVPVINNLELGYSYAKDTKTTSKIGLTTAEAIAYGVADGIKSEYDTSLVGTSIELGLPLIEEMLVPYYDLVSMKGTIEKSEGTANGSFIGVMGKVAILNYKLEYRNIDSNMTPGYFGRLYEVKSNDYLRALVSNTTKSAVSGYFGSADFNISDIVKFELAYENYDKEEVKPNLYAKLDVIPDEKIQGNISYNQIAIGAGGHKEFWLNEDTVLKGNLVVPAALIGIPGPFTANIDVEQTYNYNDAEQKYIANRIYSLGLSFVW